MLGLIGLLRPKNALPPLLWLLIGYSAAGGNNYHDISLTICFIGIALLNFFATAQNDLNDIAIDVDSGRKTILTSGQSSKKHVATIAYALLITAFCLPFAFKKLEVFWMLIVYLVACFLYNSAPTRFSRRPILSIVFLGICFSFLPALYGFIIGGEEYNFTLFSLLIGGLLFRASLSILKDYKDFEADKKHSKITFLVHFGPKTLKTASFAAHILGSAMIIAAVIAGIGFKPEAILIISLLSIYAFSERLKLGISHKDYAFNNQIFHRLLNLGLVFEAGVLACFYIY